MTILSVASAGRPSQRVVLDFGDLPVVVGAEPGRPPPFSSRKPVLGVKLLEADEEDARVGCG